MHYGKKTNIRMKASHNRATIKAYETLLLNNLPLPIDPFKIIINDIKIKIISFQEYSRKFDVSLADLTQDGAFDEGYTAFQEIEGIRRATILYNENIDCVERKRFTIAHEIGHIALGHKDLNNAANEKEADTFAAQLLLPHCILEALVKCGKTVSEDYLQKNFGLSKKASLISINNVGKKIDKNAVVEYEDIILTMYKDFIDAETYNTKYKYYEEEEEQMIDERNTWY